MRFVYQCILWLHPPAFRRRFADEMLSIFDEKSSVLSAFGLLLDGSTSLAKQWSKEPKLRTIPIALSIALLQVLWFVYARKGHQSWSEDQQSIEPYSQQLAILALATICSLFLTISLVTWTVSFQRRRLKAFGCERRGAASKRGSV